MMTKTNFIRGSAGVCAGVIASLASAQDLVHKAPPQAGPIAITGATIHTVSGGTLNEGFIEFERGVITRVGEGRYTGGARTIDATGKHVYPGLIGAVTQMGLTEIGSLADTQDYREIGDMKPEVRANVAVNPDSTIIPVTRTDGILTVGSFPSGGRIPGRASVLRMDGWTWEDMTVVADAGLVMGWPNVRPINARWMNRSESEQMDRTERELAEIDAFFDQAIAYVDAKRRDPTIKTDVRFEAMRSVLPGAEDQRPLFIEANDVDQITSAVTWAAERGLRCVIVGGRDAVLAAELLKKHSVGVVLTGTHEFPKRSDAPYDEAFTLPRRVEEAGLEWCLASGEDAAHERNLRHHAGTSAAYGLDQETAIRSITLSAAELLGVADTLGSIDKGKAATVIVTDGNPLEITTRVEMAFIDGRQIDLNNKQRALDEKYREKYRQLGVTSGQ